MEFKYPASKCDVVDKNRLGEYRKCLKRWRLWLFEDAQSIWNQVNTMMTNDCAFRVFNEARKLSTNTPHQSVGFNPAILNLIDYGYIHSQLIAIRKLACDSDNDVINLKRLIKDMKEHRHLFTRENVVCYDDLLFYDANNEFIKIRHDFFDKYSINCNKRTRNDLINPQVFVKLGDNFGSCSSIEKIANSYIAHAGDSNVRQKFTEKETKVTLTKINKCHKEICQAASFISGILLRFGYVNYVAEFPNPIQNFDKAFAHKENLPLLKKFWEDHCINIQEWGLYQV